jgi:hypothetical protein
VYKFDQVISDNYTFTATKEHYVFTSLNNVKVTPNTAVLSDIKVIKWAFCFIYSYWYWDCDSFVSLFFFFWRYDLCGQIQITALPPSISQTSNRRQILLRDERGSELTTYPTTKHIHKAQSTKHKIHKTTLSIV